MNYETLKVILSQVHSGGISVEDAMHKLRSFPFESLGFAHIDHHRTIRCGMPEVIYCPGKTTEQIVEIFGRLAEHDNNILATRAEQVTFQAVQSQFPDAEYEEAARAVVLRRKNMQMIGRIAVVSAGTADIPIAEETRVTAEILNNHVETIYDVGVAGIHRLLSKTESIQKANAVVVVAGMEGALASVVGGLVAVPVIGVPTSVGYGASFGGVAPLLTMLNSCAAGVSVVNIDNGFGAGCIASMINKQTAGKSE